MKKEQEEMIEKLIMKLESTKYLDLRRLAINAYNKGIADAVGCYVSNSSLVDANACDEVFKLNIS